MDSCIVSRLVICEHDIHIHSSVLYRLHVEESWTVDRKPCLHAGAVGIPVEK
jgi:hypothetical protein